MAAGAGSVAGGLDARDQPSPAPGRLLIEGGHVHGVIQMQQPQGDAGMSRPVVVAVIEQIQRISGA